MNVTYIPIRICFEEPVEMNEGILMKLLKLGHIKNKQSSFLFETTYDWFVGFFSRNKTNDDVMFNTQKYRSPKYSVFLLKENIWNIGIIMLCSPSIWDYPRYWRTTTMQFLICSSITSDNINPLTELVKKNIAPSVEYSYFIFAKYYCTVTHGVLRQSQDDGKLSVPSTTAFSSNLTLLASIFHCSGSGSNLPF